MEAPRKLEFGKVLLLSHSLSPRHFHLFTFSLLHSFTSSLFSFSLFTVHCSLFTVHCFRDPNHGQHKFPPFWGVTV